MRLGINGLRLMGRRFGVGRYVEYLLRYWMVQEHPFDRITAYTPGPLDDPLVFGGRVRQQTIHPAPSPAVWEHVVLPLLKPADDLFFCPSYIVPALSRERPCVVTHLGSYEAVPDAFPWWERTKARALYSGSARHADLVITVSESSRRDIVRFYGVPDERIRVIPLGVDDAFRPIDDEAMLDRRRRAFFPDGRPYVLFVGKLSTRRHIPELLEAFRRVAAERNLPHGLVLIGGDLTGQRVGERAASLGIADRVRHLPFADHATLVEAYNAADTFIYPSGYEGFGIPVLEAIACGTPTITLDNSAFPEFAGGIAHFARDGSVDGLAAALAEVVGSSAWRERTRRDGPVRAESYRWAGIAERTMAVLAEVVGR